MVRWNPPPVSDFDRQYDMLNAAIAGRKPELTIGFILGVITMRPGELDPGHRHLWTGFGCPHNGAYLLARDFSFEYSDGQQNTEWTWTPGTVAETLTHETGHMFGALHVDDPNSIMRPVWGDTPATAFDAINRQAILLHKWQDMNLGVESPTSPSCWRWWSATDNLPCSPSRPNGAAEEEARVHLAPAHLYAERGQEDLIRPELEAVLTIGVPTEIVTQSPGHAPGRGALASTEARKHRRPVGIPAGRFTGPAGSRPSLASSPREPSGPSPSACRWCGARALRNPC